MFRSVVSFARNFVTNFRNIIASLPQKMIQIGKNIVTGLWNGIKNAAGWLKEKISGFVDGIINGFKEFFGIHSPSKEMADQIGKFLPSGLGEGITGNLGSLQSAVDTMGTVVTGAPSLSPSALTDDISSAIGTGLAVQGSGASMPGSINVVVELGGTRVGEKIVNLYDYTKKAMG
jgi:phage-related protein